MKCKIGLIGLLCFAIAAACTGYAGEAVIGTVPKLLSSWSEEGAMLDESSLGDALADAISIAAEADIGLVPGGDIPDQAIMAGDCTREDVENALGYDRTLAVSNLTSAQVYELLENGLAQLALDESGKLDETLSANEAFLQISGLSMRYDITADPGSRILELKTTGGEHLDAEDHTKTWRTAASVELLSGSYGTQPAAYTEMDMTYADALEQWIAGGISEDYTRSTRIVRVGESGTAIIDSIPKAAIAALILFFVIIGMQKNQKRRALGHYTWDERIHDKNDHPLM